MQCNYNSFIQIINLHGLFSNALRCRKTGACWILVPLRYIHSTPKNANYNVQNFCTLHESNTYNSVLNPGTCIIKTKMCVHTYIHVLWKHHSVRKCMNSNPEKAIIMFRTFVFSMNQICMQTSLPNSTINLWYNEGKKWCIQLTSVMKTKFEWLLSNRMNTDNYSINIGIFWSCRVTTDKQILFLLSSMCNTYHNILIKSE